jgi:hypothetical protein
MNPYTQLASKMLAAGAVQEDVVAELTKSGMPYATATLVVSQAADAEIDEAKRLEVARWRDNFEADRGLRRPMSHGEAQAPGTRRMRVDDLGNSVFCLTDVRRIRQGDEVDPAAVGVKLMGPTTWGDGSPVKLVWVQLAEVGAWKGHVAGPFEMTPKTFDEVVRNFDDRGLPVAGDYEHASESDPTEGSVPQGGAPATGWAHRLENRGIGGLWGLVEWLEKARQQIKSGEYAFLSPAIRFGAKDPQTGASIGARLSSFAITNSPFLTNIGRLHAARDQPALRATDRAATAKPATPARDHGAEVHAMKMRALEAENARLSGMPFSAPLRTGQWS